MILYHSIGLVIIGIFYLPAVFPQPSEEIDKTCTEGKTCTLNILVTKIEELDERWDSWCRLNETQIATSKNQTRYSVGHTLSGYVVLVIDNVSRSMDDALTKGELVCGVTHQITDTIHTSKPITIKIVYVDDPKIMNPDHDSNESSTDVDDPKIMNPDHDSNESSTGNPENEIPIGTKRIMGVTESVLAVVLICLSIFAFCLNSIIIENELQNMANIIEYLSKYRLNEKYPQYCAIFGHEMSGLKISARSNTIAHVRIQQAQISVRLVDVNRPIFNKLQLVMFKSDGTYEIINEGVKKLKSLGDINSVHFDCSSGKKTNTNLLIFGGYIRKTTSKNTSDVVFKKRNTSNRDYTEVEINEPVSNYEIFVMLSDGLTWNIKTLSSVENSEEDGYMIKFSEEKRKGKYHFRIIKGSSLIHSGYIKLPPVQTTQRMPEECISVGARNKNHLHSL